VALRIFFKLKLPETSSLSIKPFLITMLSGEMTTKANSSPAHQFLGLHNSTLFISLLALPTSATSLENFSGYATDEVQLSYLNPKL